MIKINKQKVYNFYNKKSKWLGIIDNKTLVCVAIYFFITIKVISIINIGYIFKIYILTIFVLPVIIFIILNIQEESIVDKFKNIILFYALRGYYLKNLQITKTNTIYVKNVEKYHIEKQKKK